MTQRTPAVPAGQACEVTVDGHCAVCGDEALVGTVVAIERGAGAGAGTAEVNVGGTVWTVALDLVDGVAVGDAVLVHQGFAIGRVEQP